MNKTKLLGKIIKRWSHPQTSSSSVGNKPLIAKSNEIVPVTQSTTRDVHSLTLSNNPSTFIPDYLIKSSFGEPLTDRKYSTASEKKEQAYLSSFLDGMKKKNIAQQKKDLLKQIYDSFSDDPTTVPFLTKLISSKNYTYITERKLKDALHFCLSRKNNRLINSESFNRLSEEQQLTLLKKSLSEDLVPFIQSQMESGNFKFLKKDTILQCLYLPTKSLRHISRDIAVYLLENERYKLLEISKTVVEDAILTYHRVNEDLQEFTQYISENQLEMNTLRYCLLIELLNKKGKTGSIPQVFEEFLDYLTKIESTISGVKQWESISKTVSIAIQSYAATGDIKKVEELFGLSIHCCKLVSSPSSFNTSMPIEVLKPHMFSTLQTFNTLIKTYLKQNLVGEAHKLIELAFAELRYLASKKLSSAPLAKQSKQFITIINPLLNLLISGANLADADKLITSILDRNSQLQKTYNNVMNQLFSPSEYTIKPDRITFLIIIRRYCLDGQINAILDILKNMHAFGVGLSSDVIESAIVNLAFSGQVDALEKFMKMIAVEFEYKITSYPAYAIIKSYVQTGNIERAEKVFEDYQKFSYPIIGMYNLLISSYLTNLHNYEKAIHYLYTATVYTRLTFAVNQHTFESFVHFFSIASDETIAKCIKTLDLYVENNPKDYIFPVFANSLKVLCANIQRVRKGENVGMQIEEFIEQCVKDLDKKTLSAVKQEINAENRKRRQVKQESTSSQTSIAQ